MDYCIPLGVPHPMTRYSKKLNFRISWQKICDIFHMALKNRVIERIITVSSDKKP
jgi:hypothetical protein